MVTLRDERELIHHTESQRIELSIYPTFPIWTKSYRNIDEKEHAIQLFQPINESKKIQLEYYHFASPLHNE